MREENFAGGKFREIPFGVDIIFAGGKFRAKSKFANIAKITSTRKIGVIQYIDTSLADPLTRLSVPARSSRKLGYVELLKLQLNF